jgi:uncharacterized protein YegP (UPF0339 family)
MVSPVQLVPGGWRLAHGGKDGSFAWRLLGANNRELGRSVSVYDDRDACEKAIVVLVEQLALATASIAHDNASGTWTWRLDAESGSLARSARGYARQRECRYGLGVFMNQAVQDTTVVRMR